MFIRYSLTKVSNQIDNRKSLYFNSSMKAEKKSNMKLKIIMW